MSKLAHSHQETMDELDLKKAVESGNDDLQQGSEPVNALVLVQTASPLTVFSDNGLDPLIERIEKHARTIALDISTDKGRKQIRSLAHNIAQSKTALDDMGKKLVAGWKESAKKVDLERGRAWDRLEALQKEIRQPLTDWEDREKNRVALHESKLAEITETGRHTTANWQTLPADAMNDRLKELLADETDWQEFSVRAKLATEAAVDAIASAILKRQKHDAEQAELARLRKEEEERKQRQHEERLKAEAAEKARKEAEEKARKAAEAEAARVAAEKAKAEQERQKIQREKEAAEAKAKRDAAEAAAREAKIQLEKVVAEARAVQAEKDRIASEEKAKENARIAAANAAMEKEAAEKAAAQRERDRIESENRQKAEATARREADKAHRAKVNNEALAAIQEIIIPVMAQDSAAIGRAVIEAIAKGQIPHINISY